VRVASVDTGFVAAAPGRVFEVVADPAAYATWWPGARAESPSELRLPGIGRAGYRVREVRPGVELTLGLQGRRHVGRLQWYLEPFEEGTVVYGIVDLETDRRWTVRRQRGIRAGIRRAMVALKEMLE
jgi:uncharacterized protein YndB with AHSA1/START domain